nr:type II toxin-antitoxin system VapC family toxin [Pleurocapsa sp. FMAR1]
MAPYLWRSEFSSILTVYLRRNILRLEECQSCIDSACKLLQGNEFELDSGDILKLTNSCSLSAYDCEYVALARQLSCKLVTNDKEILKEFPQDTINLTGQTAMQ